MRKDICKGAESQRDQVQQGTRKKTKKYHPDFSFQCLGTKSFESNSLKEIDLLRCIFAAAYIFKNAIFLFNETGPFLISTKKILRKKIPTVASFGLLGPLQQKQAFSGLVDPMPGHRLIF